MASAPSPSRIIDVWYVPDIDLSNYSLETEYDLVSARDKSVIADPTMLLSGIDIGLFRLHMSNAPERRKLLGLKKDDRYEIMVSLAPVILHGTENPEPLKVHYGKLFDINKDDSAGGFTYKKIFYNLQMKESLNFDVKLVEIDNEKVDPEPLSQLLNDTGIGTLLDLSPYNPKQYLQLASNIVSKIQDVFGPDKEGDDTLWDDVLTLEPKPSIPSSYRLREGIYVILENTKTRPVHPSDLIYVDNALIYKNTREEVATNYLIMGIGKSRPLA